MFDQARLMRDRLVKNTASQQRNVCADMYEQPPPAPWVYMAATEFICDQDRKQPTAE